MTWLMLVFVLLLAAGVPIYLTLGVSAFAIGIAEGRPLISFAQKLLDELNSQTLMSIPFFVMAAAIMQRGGVARALVDAVSAWIGPVRGGLALVSIGGCMLFAAICGSSVATAMAMGTILIPEMLRRQYKPEFAAAVIGAGGTLGILIPPSLPLIIFGIIGEESIPRLFLAGVVPGILLSLLLALWAWFYARLHRYSAESGRLDWRRIFATSARALPALAVPAVVAIGIYGGFVTVTEAATLSAAVALLVSLLFYRGFRWTETIDVLYEALLSSAMIMMIIAVALLFGHLVTESGLPQALVRFVVDHELAPWQFLLAVNAALLVMGMFLEVASIMLITLPVLIPVLRPLGIDPVHFAIIVVVNMEIALITPPVGLNLFVLSRVAQVPLGTVIRGIWPYVMLMGGFLVVVSWVPVLSLWLPAFVYGR